MQRNPLHGHPTISRSGGDAALQIPTRTPVAGSCPVGPLERQFLDAVDGERTVAEIAASAGFSPVEAVAIFTRLSEVGAVVVCRLEDTNEVDLEMDEDEGAGAAKKPAESGSVDEGWDD